MKKIIKFAAIILITSSVMYTLLLFGNKLFIKGKTGVYGVPKSVAEINMNKRVALSFAGDVLLDGHVDTLIDKKGEAFILSDVKPILKSSDISMINLENPVSNGGIKEEDKMFTFRANPKHMASLINGGIDIVSIANNHVMDFGVSGLLDTVKYLDKSRILHVGAGANTTEAYKPVYITKEGINIAFIASSRVIPKVTWNAGVNKPGVSTTYDSRKLKEEIARAKLKADIVVVYVHWGEEIKQLPVQHQRRLAKEYIDSGADIVIGSHPHVLQGFEFYKGKIIAYSMGNFVFTDIKKDTMILNIIIEKKKISEIKVIPCEIKQYRPMLLKDPKRVKYVLNKLQTLSINCSIDEKGIVSELN